MRLIKILKKKNLSILFVIILLVTLSYKWATYEDVLHAMGNTESMRIAKPKKQIKEANLEELRNLVRKEIYAYSDTLALTINKVRFDTDSQAEVLVMYCQAEGSLLNIKKYFFFVRQLQWQVKILSLDILNKKTKSELFFKMKIYPYIDEKPHNAKIHYQTNLPKQFSIHELSYVGIFESIQGKKAIFDLPNKQQFSVLLGAKLGRENAILTEISKKEVILKFNNKKTNLKMRSVCLD